MMRSGILASVFSLLAGIVCAGPIPEAVTSYGPEGAANRILVRGTTDIELFAPVMRAFSASQENLRIDYEQWSSNDLYLVTESECQHGQSAADLVVSSSIDQQVKLANDGCAAPHVSVETASLDPLSNWRDEVFGTTREPAVIVYNRQFVPEEEAPRTRFDLIDLLRPENSRFRGRVATYDIETSGLGYMFAFADAQQATTFGSLIEAFGRSGAVATCCSSAIIDGVATGKFLIAYNVLGSYALARARDNRDLVVVAPDDYTLVLSRAAIIPKHSRAPGYAAGFIDFMLSDKGQQALRSVYLIVETSRDPHPALRLPENPDVALRLIPLAPALLVGLDRHKRRDFVSRWRETFPAVVDPEKR